MKILKLVKRLGTDLTVAEQKKYGQTLKDCKSGLAIIKSLLEREIIAIDKQLNDTGKLYSSEGDVHLKVAVLLAKREVKMNLLNLLSLEVELDADHSGD